MQGWHPHQVRMYYCYHLWLVPIIYFDKLVRVPMFWFLIKKCNVLWDKIRLKRYPKFHIFAPAQRAAGGCSPLKATPGRGPAARRNFFRILVVLVEKLMIFWWQMSISSCFFSLILLHFIKYHKQCNCDKLFCLKNVWGGV